MPMRLSGLMSGMDTESIIQQLVEAKKTKVTKAVKAQKSLKYKQDAWKDMNKQILNLYNKSLGNMRFESSFIKKVTKVSNSNVVSVITGEGAMNSVQNLEVDNLARSGYLTGGKLGVYPMKNGGTLDYDNLVEGKAYALDADGNVDKTRPMVDITGKTTLKQLGLEIGDGEEGTLQVKVGNEITGWITVEGDSTVENFVQTMRNAGVNANFDEVNQRLYVSSKASGKDADFEITALDGRGFAALNVLKLSDGVKNDKVAAELKTTYEGIRDRDGGDQTKEAGRRIEAQEQRLAAIWMDLQTSKSKLDDLGITIKGQIGTDKGDGTYVNVEQVADEVDNAVKELAELQKYADMVSGASDNDKKVMFGQKQDGADAKIKLNGVEYTSDKNTFEINGITLTVNAKPANGEVVTITTEDDTNGIYDMVKNFFKEYNTLINQMDKMYNAESAKGYDPLTDEEKEAMSDSAIEEWENKIKDSILRKDSTLGTFANELKKIMMEGVEVNGEKMYLSNFGIGTLNYFLAPENEKSAYHIDGDPDDENTSGNPDKLKSMIANDPDTVVSFFTQLSQKLYDKMFDMMKSKEGYSSAMTAYDDKKMKTDYDDYTAKIKELEKKLADYEDKWYAKFAAMETALAKMQNNASAVTSLLGG